MSNMNTAVYPQNHFNGTYGENLVRAARIFVAALFAAKPVAKPVVAEATPKARAADLRSLYRLASSFDSVSPNLAAELRSIANYH